MSVNLIFKIAAVGILVSVISQVLKHSGREEQAFLTSLAGLILVLFWIVPYIYELFEWSCVEDGTKALQGKKTSESWTEGLTQIFEAVLENKPFIMNVYRNVDRERIENYLFKFISIYLF